MEKFLLTNMVILNFIHKFFFEKGKQEVFLKTVLNGEEGITKISTCKKIEKFKKES